MNNDEIPQEDLKQILTHFLSLMGNHGHTPENTLNCQRAKAILAKLPKKEPWEIALKPHTNANGEVPHRIEFIAEMLYKKGVENTEAKQAEQESEAVRRTMGRVG